MSKNIHIRKILASMQLALISLIIISGVIFMHKEVKSNGEIVMHNHPYDFTNDQPRPQESDDQIDFLNVVYNQNFVQSEFIVFEQPIRTVVHIYSYQVYTPVVTNRVVDHAFLRVPQILLKIKLVIAFILIIKTNAIRRAVANRIASCCNLLIISSK